MVQATDVFIVGAGPAGLAVAARRYGLQVMVADAAAPPIDKTCGEGLLRDSLDALGRLGLVLERSDGYKLRGIQFFDGAAAPRAYFPAGQGRGLRRKTLHEKLIRHASHCGVCILWRTRVTGLSKDEVLVDGTRVRARWIV
jgi:2-polyprenyl-6-methoxyphenol hydroxylase-like FAD-dependent oxidoreductase